MISPNLTLDFTPAVLSNLVSFTRSGATATRTNASGLLETVPADTARLGSDGTNYLNGHLASVSYYDSFSE